MKKSVKRLDNKAWNLNVHSPRKGQFGESFEESDFLFFPKVEKSVGGSFSPPVPGHPIAASIRSTTC